MCFQNAPDQMLSVNEWLVVYPDGFLPAEYLVPVRIPEEDFEPRKEK